MIPNYRILPYTPYTFNFKKIVILNLLFLHFLKKKEV